MTESENKRFEEFKKRFFEEFMEYIKNSSEFRKRVEKTLTEQK